VQHPNASVTRRSWGPSRRDESVAEEARTRGFAAPAFAGCAFFVAEMLQLVRYLTVRYSSRQ
jgi:hypothetical protein